MKKPKKKTISIAAEPFHFVSFVYYDDDTGLDEGDLKQRLEQFLDDNLDEFVTDLPYSCYHQKSDDIFENCIRKISEEHAGIHEDEEFSDDVLEYEARLNVSLEIVPKMKYEVSYERPKRALIKIGKGKKP